MSSEAAARSDLVVLVADRDMAKELGALLTRHRSLGIRPIDFRVIKHSERDPGCCLRAEEFLRPLGGQYAYAAVIFDHAGCGSTAAASEIERDVRLRLERSGWLGRCDAIVIEPEFEAWVWGGSANVAASLRWEGGMRSLRGWLRDQGLWKVGDAKPADPKAAVESVLRQAGERRSPRLYARLGASVSTRKCEDRSFSRFREILQGWFPAAT